MLCIVWNGGPHVCNALCIIGEDGRRDCEALCVACKDMDGVSVSVGVGVGVGRGMTCISDGAGVGWDACSMFCNSGCSSMACTSDGDGSMTCLIAYTDDS